MSTLSSVKKIGNLNPVVKATTVDDVDMELNPSTYSTAMGEMFLVGGAGPVSKFCYNGHKDAVKAYKCCPPLSAIINRKAQAHINGCTWILNKEDKKESTSQWAVKLRKLLTKPNPIQTWKQFEAQRKIYVQLFGFCIVLPIIPAGFESRGAIEATSMWNLPPYMVDITETNKLFYQTNQSGIIKEIILNYKGVRTPLKADSIFFFKDFTPSFDTLILPESRVRANEQPISNIIGAYGSRHELISYAGSQGILSPDSGSGQYVSVPLDPKVKEELQDDFRRQYGIRKGQWRYIISPSAVKWQSMGVKTKDLLLIEEVQESTKSLCDGWGYPPHLLGLIDPTFNNQKEAMKGLYQDSIGPEAQSSDEEWNQFFQLEKYGLVYQTDFSGLACMQADKVNEATARKMLDDALSIEFEKGLITLDDWLTELGKDPLPNGLGQVRSTDNKGNVPLAVTLGVGGVQALISVLTATGLTDDSRQSVLEVVFGIQSTDAARMVVTEEPTNTDNGNGNSNSNDNGNTNNGNQEEN